MVRKVLILAPHTDDGELGCGGTIAKFLEEGKEVFLIAFSTCEDSVPKGMPEWTLKDELGKSTHTLGIKGENVIALNYKVRHFPENRQPILDDLIKIGREINPNLVFIPSPHDIHQDHSTIAQEAMRAFKHTSILGYELPWNNYTFNNQTFSIIEERHLEHKLAALACYESQNNRSYFQRDYQYGVCRTHGVQIGEEFAEVFETIRWVL